MSDTDLYEETSSEDKFFGVDGEKLYRMFDHQITLMV